jgi:hypothetical protein
MVREMRALKTPVLMGAGALLALLLLQVLLTPEHWGREAATNGLWYYVLPLMGLMIGCLLIARERTQREIEFSHSWPVSRRQIWAAKLIVGLLATAVIFAVVMSVALALPGSWLLRYMLSPREMTAPAVVLELLAPTVLLFGLGLLMSTVCPTPFNSIGASMLTVLLLAGGVWFTYTGFVADRWGPALGFWPPDIGASASVFVALAVMLGIAGAVASYLGFTRTLPLQFIRRLWLTLGVGLGLTVVVAALLPLELWLFGEPNAEDISSIGWGQTSPDGRWIAFNDEAAQAYYGEDGGRHISGTQRYRAWIIRTDGSGLECIGRWPAAFVGSWQHQRWLPLHWRGSDREAGKEFRWVWDAERMRLRKLPTPLGNWQVNASQTLQTSRGGRYLLLYPHIISLDDEFVLTRAQFPDDAEFAGWASDDSRIYFVSSHKPDGNFGPKALWAMSLPGGGIERVQVSPSATVTSCSVSPDGRWVAWSKSSPEDQRYLIVQSYPDGETTARFEGAALPRPPWGWSPDGRFLWARAYWKWTVISLGEELSARQVGPDWSETLTARDLHWSVDGSRCIFACGRASAEGWQHAAFVANADGSGMRKIAGSPSRAPFLSWGLAGWSDDDRVVLREDLRLLVAIDPDTLAREIIFEAPNGGYARDEQ